MRTCRKHEGLTGGGRGGTPITIPIASLAVVLVFVSSVMGRDAHETWGRFRGPNGTGVSTASDLPLEFGPTHNVVWQTPLPPGHSSPIVMGDRIYVTAFRDDALLTICVERGSGRILWEREAPRDRAEPLDERNNPASPSPVVDASSVYVFFPDYGLLSYDHAGHERWRVPLGPFNNVYGMGASPILVDDKVVLVCDQSTGSYVVALDKRDGTVRWRTERPEARSGHSTPVLYTASDGETQIIVPGSFLLTAYAADSGEKRWWVRGLSFELKSVPVLEGDTVYINGFGAPDNQPGRQIPVPPVEAVFAAQDANGDGRLSVDELPDQRSRSYTRFIDLDQDGSIDTVEWNYFRALSASENGLLAIRAGGRGDVTDTNVRWRYHRAVPQLPSPLLYGEALYMVNDGGIVTSLDPETGERIKQGRLHGAVDRYYASPVAADGKIWMVSESGKVVVLEPNGSLDVLRINDLEEDCYATPAIVDDRIYIRTVSTLYAFGS